MISYQVMGTEPHRVLVVSYNMMTIGQFGNGVVNELSFQTRLYEGFSGKIEFYYAHMDANDAWGWSGGTLSTSAGIGIAADGERFISMSPEGGDATYSKSEANNSVDILQSPIDDAVMYTFIACNVFPSGDLSQGGTIGMANGDQLLVGKKSERYRAITYMPFSLLYDGACADGRNYTFKITGDAAADYEISPSSGTIYGDETITPTITFTPTQAGVRTATLKLTDDNGQSLSYTLVAEGTPRVLWTGNVDEGGTVSLATGDLFLDGSLVPRLSSQSFTPITFAIPVNPVAPDGPVTYTIVDPTGQYKVRNPQNGALVDSYTTSIPQGGTASPTIVFNPTGVGFQPARLTVDAEGDVREFNLNAYSVAPGAQFRAAGAPIDATSQLFQKDFVCAGEYVQSYPIDVTNIGYGDFSITDVKVYRTDSVYGQGTPAYPLLRDEKGNPIPATDYFISEYPGTAPLTSQEVAFPITVPFISIRSFGNKVLYANFIPQRPGKRFARIYVYTNGENFTGVDQNGNTVLGLLIFDLFGRGLGATANGSAGNSSTPPPVVFKRTMIGDTAVATATICNNGFCDLRIGRKQFRISGGDVGEFRIDNAFPNASVDLNPEDETWVIPPDSCVTVTFSFIPSRTGSRRASIRLQTNDSSLVSDGLTERGAYYWDLVGTGAIGVETSDLTLRPGLLGDPNGDGVSGSVHLDNTTRDYIVIDSVRIVGANASEFSMDPNDPWPTLPFALQPGQQLQLGVLHTPTPGSEPGNRSARLLLFTSTGDTIIVELHGTAATRILTVEPGTLFGDVTVPVGKRVRRTLMLTNTGTMPLLLGQTQITGPTANDYTLGTLPRLLLQPGGSEFLEITYSPVSQGQSSATLTILSDATNGTQSVALGGTGRGIERSGNNGVSGVEILEREGVMLWQTQPNPSQGEVELKYRLAEDGAVELRLYDESGHEVRTLDRGTRESGDHSVRFSVDGLPSGTYHYRLFANGQVLSRSMTVVK